MDHLHLHWPSYPWYVITLVKRTLNLTHHSWKYSELNGHVDFFHFRPEISVLGKFDPKTQNCQFKLKFGTQTNSNSIVKLAFFRFQPEIPFSGKFSQKKSKLLI